MTWQPEPRPEWVRAIDAGEVLPVCEEARRPLTRDALLGEASARMGGLDDWGDDGFVEPLDVALAALEDEAQLTLTGRWLTRRFLLRLLEVRLQLVAYVAADPGVRDEEIAAPVFVTGAPRTGTTILFDLLATDPAHRVPEGWELLRPVPPPSPDPDEFGRDPRIALADLELRLPQEVVSGIAAIHEYGGRMPKECLSAMSFEFRTEELISRYHTPSYVGWLQRCDMRPAYEMHKLVLQVLQRRSDRPVQWVLKSPVHLHSLPTLLAVYPDARLAITHRDPLTVLPSVTSLVASLRWAHSDTVDVAAIAPYHAELYGRSLDRLVDLDPTLPAERVHHSRYADFVADGVGTVRSVYEHLGLPWSSTVEARMREHLAAKPKGHKGEHVYSFDDLGLDRDAEQARFARYCARFLT